MSNYYYIDAQGTGGDQPEQAEVVFQDGTRLPLTDPAAIEAKVTELARNAPAFAEFLAAAGAEVTYLTDTIPLVDTMTATQVRDLAKRLAQENRQVIQAILFLADRLKDRL